MIAAAAAEFEIARVVYGYVFPAMVTRSRERPDGERSVPSEPSNLTCKTCATSLEASVTTWLDPAMTDLDLLQRVLQPYPERLLEAYAVSKRVNSPLNEGPELIEPVGIN